MKNKRKKLGRKLLSFLLTLAMVVGLMPGMGLTAQAASTTVTWNASDIVPENPWDKSFTKEGITITAATCDFDQISFWGGGTFTTTLGNFTKIEISADYAGEVSGTGWSNDGWQSATWTGDAASVSFSGDIWGGGMTCDGGNLTIKFTIEVSTVDVTGVTLNPSAAQTIDVDGKVSFTATVAPDNATDKTVRWSVGGTDAGAVKLYTDADCTTEVGADATETLTVYAKGISAGSATVTVTSNADSTKSAGCTVTVNAAAHTHNDITFTAWTSTNSMPTEAGNYYLANDVTLGSTWNVPTGITNLCLNGHAIKSTGNHRMMEVGAGVTLSLYDEGTGVHKYTLNGNGLAVVDDNATGENVKTFEGGYLTGAYAYDLTGACVLVKDGGIFNMHGGTMIGNYAANYAFGGAVSVQGSRFEMTGGKMIGNVSLHGAVDTRGGGDGFIMKGGEISYNTASNQGGGVCMGGSGIATISGGKITNNIALGNPDGCSESGGIVFRSGASALNISGNPIIKDNVGGDVYLWSGKKINVVGELTSEASIGITIKPATGTSGYASGVFTNSSDTSFNIVGAFFSNSQDYAVGKNADGQLFLGSPIVTLTYDGNGATGGNVPAETTGYASGSVITVPGNTNSLVKTGLVFDGWNTMADGSGTAYAADQTFNITANTTLYAQWSNIVASVTTSGGVTTEYADLSAALNNWTEGSTLKLYADANLNSTITVNNTKTLDLNGFGMIRKYVSGDKGARNQGVFDVMGGDLTIIDSNADVVHRYKPATDGAGRATDIGKSDGTASFKGGYITGDVYGVSLGNQGTLNFKGGTIIGHERTGIWIEPGTLNMSDNAAIIANSCWGNGGGVELENGTFKMTGGTISNNMAVNAGGGVFCAGQNTTLQLLGGSITGNVAKNFGGGVNSPGSTGTFEISGNVSITDNKKSDGTDNNVWLWDGAKISITGALSDGAQIGIIMNTPGVFTSSSTVSNNDASKFSSDNNDYSVFKNADEQLCLGTSYTVTFKVVNGSWDDETTADKTVTLNGYVGAELKLTENQIPAVGSKPNNTYKAGSWDVTPSADTAITEATTYTYTYVAKEASVVTKAPEAKTLTYTGSAQSLVTAGEATGGTLYYAVTTENTAPTDESLYTTSIPTKTNAGTYYVWYKVKADENHIDTDADYVEVSIGKRSVTLTSATASKVYDGTALTNTDVTVGGDGFVTGEGATYNVTGTQTLPGNSKNTFGYTLKTGTTAGNYEITMTEGTLTVTDRTDEEGNDKKYEITVTANSDEVTYDGTEKSVSGFVQTTFTINGVTYTVSGLTATAKGTDAGSYTTEVTGTAVVKDANDNDLTNQFIVSTSNGTLTINKRNVTLTSATASKTYDGNALTDNTVTTSGDGFATGEGATYNVTGSQKVVGSSANAFTYTLNTGTKEANYNIIKTEGTLTVTSRDAKYQISPKANSDELKYDGQSHEVTGFETDTFIVEGNTYTVSGLTAAGSGTDAGSYTVSVSGTAVVKDSDGNDVSDEFAVTPQTGTLTINKRKVTMTSATDTKEYDGDALTNKEVTVTGDGFITGEGADYDVTGTRTLVGVSENTFTYTLKDNTKADNYDITTSYGTLTVNNRNTKYEVTLKANSGKEKYDGTSKAVSGYTIDGNAGEGTGESVVTSFTASNGKIYTVTGMSAEVTATNAGEYAVNVIGTPIVKDADGNDVTTQFAVLSESGKLTIDKRSVTLTSATDTKVFDGKALSNDEITVSEDGFAEGEGATYYVTGSQTLAGVSANAFTYALSDGTIAGNYDITTVEGKLIVTKSDSSGEVTPESGLVDDEKANRCPIIILYSHSVSGLVYDGNAKVLVTAGKTEGGTLMYRLGTDGKWQSEIPVATDAGTYKIYYYIKGDDNHKDDGSEKEPKGSVETTIKKAAQDKPTETFAVAEASDDKTADGKISGLDKAKTYQYSADDGKTWTDVKAGSTEIVVKSGTYQIRYAEDKNREAGKAASVTVTAKVAPSPEPAKKEATINFKSVTQKNNKVQVSWTKVNEADGYDVYINYCGSEEKKAAKTIKGNSTTSASFIEIDGNEINQKKSFRVRVYAYKMVNGKKIIIAKTITAHLAGTKSVKYTNPKALKLTKSAYQIKVKKTAQIEAKVTLENSSKMLLPESHAAKFRYKSSNTKIATVNKNGKITGKSKGTCYIYVYTVNGLMKKVKVTVK